MLSNVVPIALCAVLIACASAPSPPAARATHAAKDERSGAILHSIEEREAVALIEDLLREATLRPVQGWRVALPRRGAFEVDLRLGDTAFGVEWVSEQDRSRYGDVLPAPGPEGQLRLLTAPEGGARGAQILVLDHETYRVLASDGASAGRSRAGSLRGEQTRELEQRLRRDLTDFIEYARSQYRL